MKKEKKVKNKEKSQYDKTQFIVKILALVLVVIMLVAWAATLIFSLMS